MVYVKMVNGWVRRATYATFCTALLFYVFNLLRNKHCNQKQRNIVAWQLSCCGLPTMLRKKLHEFAAHFITPLSPALQLAKQINASDWPVSPRFIKKKMEIFYACAGCRPLLRFLVHMDQCILFFLNLWNFHLSFNNDNYQNLRG